MKLLKMFALSTLVLMTAGLAQAGFITPGLESQLTTKQNDDVIRVLVVMDQQADIRALDWDLYDAKAGLKQRHKVVLETLQGQAEASQADLLASLENRKAGGDIVGYTSHWIVNGVVVTGTVDAIRQLAKRDDVERIEADLVVELIEPIPSAKAVGDASKRRGVGTTPGVTAVGARRVWEEFGIDGSGVVVGNLDTGVDGNHVALQSRWRGNFAPVEECWRDEAGFGDTLPTDRHGHGSHVMGTITGLAEDDTIGVAPGALWIASNIINSSDVNEVFDNGVIASLEWMADPDGDPQTTEDVPAVVQNSWGVNESFTGYLDCDSRWWDAIMNCEAAGVVLTWSAGNEGPGSESLRSPADRAYSPTDCFSVGSTIATPPYTISSFSSRGPSGCGGEFAMKPEIVAPGSDIYSVQAGGGYTFKSGTSMAGPHIAGVVALMRASNPNLDVITVKEVLMNTAIDLGDPGEDQTYGHGFVDAYEAVLAVIDGVGTVEGYVLDSVSGLPVTGAVVKKVGAGNRAVTDASGFYSMTMPAGNTDFTINYFGYSEGTLNVTIPDDDSTVNGDVSLVALPTSVLSGFVYGPDTNIVPGASVTAVGTPLAPAIADQSGFYSLALPSGVGNFYDVRARINGLGHQTQNIEMVGDLTLDFNLPELFAEDFESGDFSSYIWEQGANPWVVTGTAPYEGLYAGKSGDIGDGQESSLSITMEIADIDGLMFWYKVSSEANYDYLRFYIDGVEQDAWAGTVPWTLYTTTVGPGVHTFAWIYQKDGSVSSGDDAAYLDFIEFPEQGTPGTPAISLDPTSFTAALAPEGTADQTLTISSTGTASLVYNVGLAEIVDARRQTTTVPHLELAKGQDDPRAGVVPVTGAGGPDAFGYNWADSDEPGGPVYNWVDISGTGAVVPNSDDGNEGPYDLGFDFSYYGSVYNSVNVCTNGWVSFTSTSTAYSNQGIPDANDPNDLLAAFWDDLNPNEGGTIYYQQLNGQFVVQYEAVEHFLGGSPETFQIILNSDGSIIYQYAVVSDGLDCTVGIENAAGDDGLQVVFDGNYLHDGLAIRIASAPPLTWVTADPLSGLAAPLEDAMVNVHFDAAGLTDGTYFATMFISSNDPAAGLIELPVTMIVDGAAAVGDLPTTLLLNGAVPNPFNPQTDIKFSLPHDGRVELNLYDVSGRLVRSLVSENMSAGAHSVRWNGRDDAGKAVASGTYFMRLVADGETNVRSMVLVR